MREVGVATPSCKGRSVGQGVHLGSNPVHLERLDPVLLLVRWHKRVENSDVRAAVAEGSCFHRGTRFAQIPSSLPPGSAMADALAKV